LHPDERRPNALFGASVPLRWRLRQFRRVSAPLEPIRSPRVVTASTWSAHPLSAVNRGDLPGMVYRRQPIPDGERLDACWRDRRTSPGTTTSDMAMRLPAGVSDAIQRDVSLSRMASPRCTRYSTPVQDRAGRVSFWGGTGVQEDRNLTNRSGGLCGTAEPAFRHALSGNYGFRDVPDRFCPSRLGSAF
jgi:hypothetical protein